MRYQWQDHQVDWDKNRVSRALLECDAVYRSELSELTCDLNRYHGVSWSSDQYEKVMGFWLRTFIHILYDRWHGSGAGKPNQIPWDSRPAVDLLDFASYHTSDPLNESLYWQLATLKNKGHLNRLPLPERLSFSSSYRVLGTYKTPIQIHNPYHSYGLRGWRRRLTLNGFPRELANLASEIRIRPKAMTSHQIDTRWRLSRIGQSITGFREAISVMVRIHAPALIVEGFRSMRSAASQHPIRRLYAGSAYHPPLMYLAAEGHKTTRLFLHQHGGGYGLDKRLANEDYERAVSDCFFTWGWSEGATTRPLPVPPRIRSRSPRTHSGILLKCANFPRYVPKIVYMEMASANQVLIEQTIQFAKAVANHGLEISYFPQDYGWNVRKQFDDARVNIPERSRTDEKYAIHTCNYLGTAWLETLAANIPTICFYDPNVYEFREAAIPFIEELKDAGILHESPDSASDKVLSILGNPLEWWRSDEVQGARLAFVQRYARLEDGWLSEWTEEFSRVANLTCERD